MRIYGEVEVYLSAFSNTALIGSEWSASPSGRLIATEITFFTQLLGSWVDFQSLPAGFGENCWNLN
jgi:hypothetical protein